MSATLDRQKYLLKQLGSRWKDKRLQAIAEARSLPPEEIMELLALEKRLHTQRKKRSRFAVAGIIGGLALLIVIVSAVYNWILLALLSYLYLPLFLLIPTLLPSRARGSLLKVIETTEDPRFVGPALILLAEHGPNMEVKKSVQIALTRLLPNFRADQTTLLNPEQMKALMYHLLNPYLNVPLSLCILKTLEQIGDPTAIPAVRKIAEKKTPSPQQWPVVDAAQQCLPYLESHAGQVRQMQTLLRASNAADADAPGQLLRPADRQDTTPVELLLRVPNETAPVIPLLETIPNAVLDAVQTLRQTNTQE